MKFRKGFVSNSSSSSFILAIRKDLDVCSHCGRSDPSFFELVERSHWHRTHIDNVGWDKVFTMWDEYSDSSKSARIHEFEKKYKNDEWTVAEFTIAFGEEELEKMIRESNDIVVLQSDEEEPEGGW